MIAFQQSTSSSSGQKTVKTVSDVNLKKMSILIDLDPLNTKIYTCLVFLAQKDRNRAILVCVNVIEECTDHGESIK